MNAQDYEKAFLNAEKLKNTTSSYEICKDSLKILSFSQDDKLRKLIFFLFELGIASVIAHQVDTNTMLRDIIVFLAPILVALIAIVFAGYAFFQAVMTDELLVALLSETDEKQGNLINTNSYFAELMEIQFICLLLDIFTIAVITIIPAEWCLFRNRMLNEIVSTLIITPILYCNTECICEMKSFVFNVFQLFNLSSYARIRELKRSKK